jgi:D-glyceraldehyde dehydrogenase (NADP+)
MEFYINGQYVKPENENEIPKYSPVTGELLYNFPSATKTEAQNAVDSAMEAFPAWSATTSKERSMLLLRVYNLMESRRSELEDILMKENGKIISEAKGEVDGVLDQLWYYIGFERKLNGDFVEGDTSMRRIIQSRVPYGVVLALTPWNFPAAMVIRKLAPALLCGNTVIVKPSSDTPGSAEWIVRKFSEAGFPKGVVNFITGSGSTIGDYLVENRKVSLITMTGSTEVGMHIMNKASSNMAKLILELGGKAPFMVWKDADLKKAVDTLMWAKYSNAGQSCIAAERLYVHEDVYLKFLQLFKEASMKITMGSPIDGTMGPLINRKAISNTSKIITQAEENGSKVTKMGLAAGDKKFQNGFYYNPVLVEDADQNSNVFQEEIFAPVLPAMSVHNEDELLKLANDSKYGLASYLFTRDIGFAMRLSEGIRFGELYINMPGPESSQGYHTGFRMTGQAGEGSVHGIEEYLHLKNTYIDFSKD